MNKLKELRNKVKKNNKGFSLVELIVVIVILAILIGVTIGGIYQYVNKAKDNTLRHNLDTIEKTVSTFQATDKFQTEIRKNFKYITLYSKFDNTDSVLTYKGVENGEPILIDENNNTYSFGPCSFEAKEGVKIPDKYESGVNWYVDNIYQILQEVLPDGIPKADFASDGAWILAVAWNQLEDVMKFKLIPIYKDKYSALNFQPDSRTSIYFKEPDSGWSIVKWWNFNEDFLYFKDYK